MRAYLAELSALAADAGRTMGDDIGKAADLVAGAALAGRTTLVFGNGGSATQAQHFAAELVVRYRTDRRALPALALAADVSVLTACANDYGYETVFARQVEALGRPGDVAVGLSTSGKSPNVLKALAAARSKGLATVLMTGEGGRGEARNWDVGIVVPSSETAHVQELHLAAIHLVCRHVEDTLSRRG